MRAQPCSLVLWAILACNCLGTIGCSEDEPVQPTTGIIQGAVTEAGTSLPVSSVRVVVFDANTNAPLLSLTTGGDGSYSIELGPGTYLLKFARQGYEDLPPRDISPLPVTVTVGQTTPYSVQMFKSSLTNTGAISGKVLAAGSGVPGCLVVAEGTASGFSATTDASGVYLITNVQAGSYTVKAWKSGYTSTAAAVNVTAATEQKDVNVTLSAGVSGSVSGSITFLATTNIEVDVSLLNLKTRETVPGLSTTTISSNFTIANVPDGTYLARATYKNDGKVMDPDWIIKNGEPIVTVSGGATTRNFSVTGAVDLVSPTNPPSDTQPIEVVKDTLRFTWVAYPSTDDYVIEVINQNGTVIWGGFASNWTVKKITIPKTQTSIVFNADASATEQLTSGKFYRWKIYSSKNDAKEPTGWKLISNSEDQRGLIRIK